MVVRLLMSGILAGGTAGALLVMAPIVAAGLQAALLILAGGAVLVALVAVPSIVRHHYALAAFKARLASEDRRIQWQLTARRADRPVVASSST